MMRLLFAVALSVFLPSTTGFAQDWPQRPVRLILPFAAGGAADVVTRIVMQRVSEQTGQSFFVDNRTGGSGNIGSEMAARAAADGYTYLVGSPGTLAINPHLFKTLPYDALNDFVPVVHIAKFPQVLAVHGEVKAQTVRDLIALAKAQPGAINYGSGGSGSTGHLITESFLTQAGIKVTHVPFRGGAPAVQALLGGTVQMVIDGLPSFTAHMGTGRIRLLGITSGERWPGTPEVPTIAESGVPGFDLGSWVVIAAPAKTPTDILRKFASEATKAAQVEDVRTRLRQAGASAAGSTPEEAMRFQRAEYEKWGAIVRATGAKAD